MTRCLLVWFLFTIGHTVVTAQDDLQVFLGNLHSHTSYSDGSGTPMLAYRFAEEDAELDFMAITEHNHSRGDGTSMRNDDLVIALDPILYNGQDISFSLIKAANRANQNGEFVAIYGQEFSTISSGNHVNVFMVDSVIDCGNGEFDELKIWLEENQDAFGQMPLVQLNHPGSDRDKEYGRDDFDSERDWLTWLDSHAQLVEVLNGPGLREGTGHEPEDFESEYRRFLRLGLHLGPTGNQDNHHPNWGLSTDARTGVITDELTREKIIEALRQRHVYATTDKNLRIIVKVNDNLMGDILTPPAPGTPITFSYHISDDDEPDAGYVIQIFSGQIGEDKNAQLVDEVEVQPEGTAGASGTIEGNSFLQDGQYFYCRIFQNNVDMAGERDRAWTAPIWFESSNFNPPPLPDDTGTANAYASKHSGIFHISEECINGQQISPSNRVEGAEATEGRTQHIGCPNLPAND